MKRGRLRRIDHESPRIEQLKANVVVISPALRNTSMARPPPSMARTFERSSTMIRAALCELTASRNLKAASLRTILFSHSMIAILPIVSIGILSMFFSQPCSGLLWETRASPSIRSCILCRVKRLINRDAGSFGRGQRKSALQKMLYFLQEC